MHKTTPIASPLEKVVSYARFLSFTIPDTPYAVSKLSCSRYSMFFSLNPFVIKINTAGAIVRNKNSIPIASPVVSEIGSTILSVIIENKIKSDGLMTHRKIAFAIAGALFRFKSKNEFASSIDTLRTDPLSFVSISMSGRIVSS